MKPVSKESQMHGWKPGPKEKKPIQSKMTASTYLQMFQSKDRKKKKYHNKSKVYTTSLYGTRTFDSIKEANYCEELDWRLKNGDIKHYWLQWKFDIKIYEKHWRNYYIDFRVEMPDGSFQYVEVKGYETEVWKMKWDALLLTRMDLIEPGSELIVIK